MSWKRYVYKSFPDVCETLMALPVDDAIIDREIVCLDDRGRPQFCDLLYHRAGKARCFYAFDLLYLNGRDLQDLPLIKREQLLREIVPPNHPGILYASDLSATNTQALFEEILKLDLEGLVLKWKQSTYGAVGKWVKMKNPQYSQAVGRHELLFAPRRKPIQSTSESYPRMTAKFRRNGVRPGI